MILSGLLLHRSSCVNTVKPWNNIVGRSCIWKVRLSHICAYMFHLLSKPAITCRISMFSKARKPSIYSLNFILFFFFLYHFFIISFIPDKEMFTVLNQLYAYFPRIPLINEMQLPNSVYMSMCIYFMYIFVMQIASQLKENFSKMTLYKPPK